MRTVEFLRSSVENLTARERLLYSDTTTAIRIDKAIDEAAGELILDVAEHFVLCVKQDGEEYEMILIVTDEGEKYASGSASLIERFYEIADAMGDESFSVVCYKKPSKKREGKYFITCGII